MTTPDERFARATIGAPLSEADRSAAAPAFERGMAYVDRHEWGNAVAQFREAVRLDGSVAAYHAALGEVFLIQEQWADAEAEYTAALLIDVENTTYRARLKQARARR
jgi:Tfp pilus assembly protein PilF